MRAAPVRSAAIACALLMLLVAGAARAASAPAFFPADAVRGKSLSVTCFACHGPPNIAVGTPAVHPPKLVGQRPDVIFLALLAYQRGTRASAIMGPIAAALSLQDMRDLGAYIAAEGPDRPPVVVFNDTWAREEVHHVCTACHGESGMGEMWGIPVITGQNRDYLVYALNGYRDGARREPTMRGIAAGLTVTQIERLADYFSQQQHLRLDR